MVLGNMSFYYLDLVGLTIFTNQFPDTLGQFAGQYLFSVLGYPDQMVLYIVNGKIGFSILLYQNKNSQTKVFALRRGIFSHSPN